MSVAQGMIQKPLRAVRCLDHWTSTSSEISQVKLAKLTQMLITDKREQPTGSSVCIPSPQWLPVT